MNQYKAWWGEVFTWLGGGNRFTGQAIFGGGEMFLGLGGFVFGCATATTVAGAALAVIALVDVLPDGANVLSGGLTGQEEVPGSMLINILVPVTAIPTKDGTTELKFHHIPGSTFP